jgi:DNA-binding response OmpR family regulator
LAQQRILIFADDPRLCRLLLREANTAGFEGMATTKAEVFEVHHRSSAPDITLVEVDGPLDRVTHLLELVSACQNSRLVLLSAVNGPRLGEIVKLANGLGAKIGGILHKPMGIEAIRAVLRNQKRATSGLQGGLTTQWVDHGPEQFT